MKKFLALLLALVMALSLFACGKKDDNKDPNDNKVVKADDIKDEMTSADGKYEIAFVTDVGALKDKSFNQGTYDGVKLYANANNLSYKYYQPANKDQATDDDRFDAMKAACDNGAKVVVCAGFMQGAALARAGAAYPDVKFVFIDGWPLQDANGNVLTNVTGINFREEQCGYLAGYAAVKEGYTKLGFTGGGAGENEACCRYGYGYVQGASAAAKEMNVKVEMNYSWLYGGSFQASPELQTMASGWYTNGTEVIFSCGGSMFASIAQAEEAGAKVIGVDVDQSFESDTVITSAMKGIGEAAQQALAAALGSTWDQFGGKQITLGAKDNAVGLPTATWSLKGWTVDEYKAMLKDMADGKLVVDNDFNKLASTDSLTLNIVK